MFRNYWETFETQVRVLDNIQMSKKAQKNLQKAEIELGFILLNYFD